MIRIILLLVSMISCNQISAQKQVSPPVVLSMQQTEAVFTDSIKRQLKLSYPIYRVYRYGDRSGLYYCVLTESRDTVGEKKDTMNHFIRAVTCKVEPMGLKKLWEINDQVISVPSEEDNIWFWTKYIEFKDHDGDGLIEPLIVYGSTAMNGYDDGRVKFLVFYKGQKMAIRHKNGVLDFEREMTVDRGFYLLPAALQASVRQKMKNMEKAGQAIFPNGWEIGIKAKKTVIAE